MPNVLWISTWLSIYKDEALLVGKGVAILLSLYTIGLVNRTERKRNA